MSRSLRNIQHRTRGSMWSVLGVAVLLVSLVGCGEIGGGGNDTGTPGEVLCTPDHPNRPRDCKLETESVMKTPDDFRSLCRTKCSKITKFNVCVGESICPRSTPALDRIAALPPVRGIKRTTSSVEIRGGPGLADLSFMSTLEYAGDFELRQNSNLTTLEGVDSLKTIHYELNLEKNSALESLEGLDALKRLGYLELLENPKLRSLSELKDVTFYEKGFGKRGIIIRDNDSLRTLDGLQGAETLGVNLEITKNDELRNLKGLGNLQEIRGQLIITRNPKLPRCKARQLADRVEVDGLVKIENNGSGNCSP